MGGKHSDADARSAQSDASGLHRLLARRMREMADAAPDETDSWASPVDPQAQAAPDDEFDRYIAWGRVEEDLASLVGERRCHESPRRPPRSPPLTHGTSREAGLAWLSGAGNTQFPNDECNQGRSASGMKVQDTLEKWHWISYP
jgi:hypothetical protein